MTEWHTCVHEAGHCVCAFLLRATAHAGPVTVVRHGELAGCSFTGRAPEPTAAERRHLGAAYPLLPARLKRRWECAAMVCFAGQIAEERWLTRALPVLDEDEDAGVSEPEAEVLVLPEREARLLESTRTDAAAADEATDLSQAWDVLLNLNRGNGDLAERHSCFLHAETEALMGGARAGRLVCALAAELAVHKTLSAARWKAVLRGC